MVLLAYGDALFEMVLREPERVSYMLGAAEVSSERVVTFLSSQDSSLSDP